MEQKNLFTEYKSEHVKRILLVRSSAKLFPDAVNDLRATFPDAQIDCVLTQKASLGTLNQELSELYRTPHAHGFRWRDIAYVAEQMKGTRYDLAVVLYNSTRGNSYLNIDTFARAARPQKILTVNLAKEVQELTDGRYHRKIGIRCIALLWAGVNIILTLLVALLILAAMVITAPIICFLRMRKQKNPNSKIPACLKSSVGRQTSKKHQKTMINGTDKKVIGIWELVIFCILPLGSWFF